MAYVCLCKAVTDRRIRAAIEDGATTLSEIKAETGAGTGCGGCLRAVKKQLLRVLAENPEIAATASGAATGTYRFGRPAAIAAAPMVAAE